MISKTIEDLELSFPQKTILIVDDNRTNLDILSEILVAQNYKIRRAINGEIALQSVGQLKPDLILLDITMPGLTGYEVCQHLKRCPDSKHIPVIFISALNEPIDKVTAFSVGGVDYISKPFEIVEVLARVKNQLSIHTAKEELRNALDQQLQQRALELTAEAERSHVLAQVVDKVRRTLEPSTIFKTATEEIRNLLRVDRTAIIQLNQPQLQMGGMVIAESKTAAMPRTVGSSISGDFLDRYYNIGQQEAQATGLREFEGSAVIHDLSQYSADLDFKQTLAELQVCSSVTIPIFEKSTLWGLFCIHQSAPTERWLTADIDFSQKVCVQLGVALHQAQLLKQTQDRAAELSRTLADLKAIVDNLADGLLVTDLNGIVTQLNPAILKMLDIDETQLLQKPLSHYFPKDLSSLVHEIGCSGQTTGELEVELCQGHQGKALVSPILTDSRSPVEDRTQGCVILIRDITREKEVDRMKTDFLSTVSHELRTPLTSVLGFASIIESKLHSKISPAIAEDNLKAQKALRVTEKNLRIVVSEAERLTILINEVLDIAKMEEGKVSWDFQSVNPASILKQAIEATTPLFAEKPVELIEDIPDSLPNCLLDKNRILQVLINLISNAIKFTDKGFVRCCGSIQDGKLLIRVIDSGIGLSVSQQDKVFEKFTQMGNILTSKPQGSGLGLSICEQIIEAHGGRIWVESQPGCGCIFSVSIPLVPQPKALTNQASTNEHVIQNSRVAV